MLLVTFVTSLLENVSGGKEVIRTGEGTMRATQDF